MTLTLHFTWWLIPTIITMLSILAAFLWPADRDGWGGAIVTLIFMIPALFVSMLSWIVAAILK